MELIKVNTNVDGLQLNPIEVDENYAKEWGVNSRDFLLMTFNGEILRNTLYRKGGLTSTLDFKNKYFLLLKHTEDIYDLDFIKKCYPNKSLKEQELGRKHLKAQWVIVDSEGFERVEFKQFASPYLTKDSVIYSLDSKYYNIETGELLASTYNALESKEFLFAKTAYEDKTKDGVLKINKKDGSWELFSAK